MTAVPEPMHTIDSVESQVSEMKKSRISAHSGKRITTNRFGLHYIGLEIMSSLKATSRIRAWTRFSVEHIHSVNRRPYLPH